MGKRTRAKASFTINPSTPAPQLFCPCCQQPLVYRQTIENGVLPMNERWDIYECRVDGAFEYRHRTRALRASTALPTRSPDRDAQSD
jgi:hypothetical protein